MKLWGKRECISCIDLRSQVKELLCANEDLSEESKRLQATLSSNDARLNEILELDRRQALDEATKFRASLENRYNALRLENDKLSDKLSNQERYINQLQRMKDLEASSFAEARKRDETHINTINDYRNSSNKVNNVNIKLKEEVKELTLANERLGFRVEELEEEVQRLDKIILSKAKKK